MEIYHLKSIAKVGMDRTIKNILKKNYEKGISLLEALVATAIVGIGFVAVFQIVNYQHHQLMYPLKEQK